MKRLLFLLLATGLNAAPPNPLELAADGVTVKFNPDGTRAGINVGSHATDPTTLGNGDLWYNSTGNALKARINGATVSLGSGGGSGSGDALIASPLTQFTGILASNAEFNFVDGVTSNIQTQLDAKQTLDSDLTSIAALTTTSYGRGLLDDADAAAARTTLGLGTLSTQAADSVAITGGSISGVTLAQPISVGAAVGGSLSTNPAVVVTGDFTITTGTFTVNTSTEVITTNTAHLRSVNEAVVFTSSGTLPSGMLSGVAYYVLTAPSATTMTVGTGIGIGALNLTTTGTGTHTFTRASGHGFASEQTITGATGLTTDAYAVQDIFTNLGTVSGTGLFNHMSQQQYRAQVYQDVTTLYGMFSAPEVWAGTGRNTAVGTLKDIAISDVQLHTNGGNSAGVTMHQGIHIYTLANSTYNVAYQSDGALARMIQNGQAVFGSNDYFDQHASAQLQVDSTTRGFLPPRMTAAQKTAINGGAPATGLMVYQTDSTAGPYYYNGSAWTAMGGGGGSGDVTAAATFATDNRIIRSDGTSKGVQKTGWSIADTDEMSATVDGDGEVAVSVIASGETAIGVSGAASGVDGVGVLGVASNTTGRGVEGQGAVSGSVGVWAAATHASAVSLAVVNSAGAAANFTNAGTANRAIVVPDAAGTLALTNGNTWTGAQNFNGATVQMGGALIVPAAAMSPAYQINVGKQDQTQSISGTTALTLSATPATDTWFGFTLTASGSGPYVVPLPAGTWKSESAGGTITTITMASSTRRAMNVHYDGTYYHIYNDPTTASGSSPTTTRGDLIRRGASADERLAKGGIGDLLTSDGTDVAWHSRRRLVTFYEDFVSGNSTLPNSATSYYSNSQAPTVDAIGTAVTNSNANTGALAGNFDSFTFGAGAAKFEARVRPLTRLSSTGNLIIRVGFGDTTGSSAYTDGVWLEYTDNVNSGNWVGHCKAGGAESTVNLAVGPAVNTWYLLSIEINAGATAATFSVDGANAQTLTSANIPNSTSELVGIVIGGTESVGLLNQMYTDYIDFNMVMTTAR